MTSIFYGFRDKYKLYLYVDNPRKRAFECEPTTAKVPEKPEIEFQYAETFLRECADKDASDKEDDAKENTIDESDKGQEYARFSNNQTIFTSSFNDLHVRLSKSKLSKFYLKY